ncbi:MAG: hypothetical protein JWQ90_262 [Hydrocarboniphaga sp.]|uniref:DUF6279 family lipoprotein n=1 Tax=Hydrocarboniphaga sp. TaxID=2033016 RepID=UPI00260F6B9A|nr:DUF6279 family lipoprotein [Hydrocarboniphaga sp.]MDB5967812.1 hypothetical protein [Hydrocarboniphaga sp.]
MPRTRKLIAAAAALAALLVAGCSSIGLVYNRLDTLAHFQIGRYVDLNPQQRADFDSRFNALWAWHRRSQLPLYAHDLRELAQTAAAPLTVQQLQQIGERWREHADRTTRESLRVAAPTLAALSEPQLRDMLAAIDKRAAKETGKQQKLDDTQWRETRVKEAAERLAEWASSVTPAQRQRIDLWADSLKRPPPDPQAARRRQFAELLKTRRDAGFEQRLQDYAFAPFTGEIAEMNEPQTQASRQLLADLSGMLTAKQRAYLRDKLNDMAAQIDELSR